MRVGAAVDADTAVRDDGDRYTYLMSLFASVVAALLWLRVFPGTSPPLAFRTLFGNWSRLPSV